MNTKIIFNTDSSLKTRAQRKARAQGLTLSAVLNLATRAYVDDLLTVDVIGRDIAHARSQPSVSAAETYRQLGIRR